MPETADGDGSSFFAFVLPARGKKGRRDPLAGGRDTGSYREPPASSLPSTNTQPGTTR